MSARIDDEDRLAMCKACTLAECMKDCRSCAFNMTGSDKNPGILEQMSNKINFVINYNMGEPASARRKRESTVRDRLRAENVPYTVEDRSFGGNLYTSERIPKNIARLIVKIEQY